MQNFTPASLGSEAGPVSALGVDGRFWLLSGLDAPVGHLLQDWPASSPRRARAAERLGVELSAAGDAR